MAIAIIRYDASDARQMDARGDDREDISVERMINAAFAVKGRPTYEHVRDCEPPHCALFSGKMN